MHYNLLVLENCKTFNNSEPLLQLHHAKNSVSKDLSRTTYKKGIHNELFQDENNASQVITQQNQKQLLSTLSWNEMLLLLR